jgi:hypothetical protein
MVKKVKATAFEGTTFAEISSKVDKENATALAKRAESAIRRVKAWSASRQDKVIDNVKEISALTAQNEKHAEKIKVHNEILAEFAEAYEADAVAAVAAIEARIEKAVN